ncbi:reverse transcriptase [Gossypium australe]|uniref:Reverse transcriptase n=1 Tax=Gossypium australe TaxID=47621 RepID=A0A5B6VP98_9ROSI|nr:reverse transcriptase [Gossypium australe]
MSLNCWAKKEKKLKERQKSELNERLFELGASEISEATLEEITDIKLELNFEVDKEEIFWEQRARTNWLRMRDKNTTFFHRSASYCKKKNMVKGLEDGPENLVIDIDEMSKMAANYFKDLFSSKEISDCDRLLASFSPCITEELNRDLMAEFKAEEVAMAIKSIAPLKASEVTKYCLDVLNSWRNMEEINKTSIAFIPKFRSISLCNVIYKIIAKVPVNRFCQVLNYCIEDNQGAFISGRQITNYIFVAYEILHSFKKRRGLLKKGFALKLDMSKVYDRIEWSYLEKMLHRLGFCED